MFKKAFTLIELLIVVAIIAILAAIAVPNFLEAQVRSKVSRTKADMRTMATALEAYAVDNNTYPQCHGYGIAMVGPGVPAEDIEILERLSTPISYMSSVSLHDPFKVKGRLSAAYAADLVLDEPRIYPDDWAIILNSYIYQAFSSKGRAQTDTSSYEPDRLRPSAWILHSAGPDRLYHNLGGVLALEYEKDDCMLLMYDPTNGTVSFGSIYRSGGSTSASPPEYAGGQGLIGAINASTK